ncbi:hypothetical protein FOPE_05054 [Fonsecaea pedrosoi]|nr:hypothetical protein FOPE_05054 [Fonsecaea pedrosoi]
MFTTFQQHESGSIDLTAVEKKRQRDRRAQQKLRERRDLHVKELEEQVALCKEHHHEGGQSSIVALKEEIKALKHENTTLLARCENLSAFARTVRQNLSQVTGGSLPEGGDSSVDGMNATLEDLGHDADPLVRVTSVQSSTTAPIIAVADTRSPCAQPSNRLTTTAVVATPSSLSENSIDYSASAIRAADTSQRRTGLSCDRSFDYRALTQSPASGDAISPFQSSIPQVRAAGRRTQLASSWVQRLQDMEGQLLPASEDVDSHARRSQPLDSRSPTEACNFPDTSSQWNILPNDDIYHPLCLEFAPLSSLTDLIVAAPLIPDPAELLFGSRQNHLANEIHKSCRKSRVAETERLANGWLLYAFYKWRYCPSKTTFDLLPAFLRPTPIQVTESHPACFDMMWWPAMRTNTVRRYMLKDPSFDHRSVMTALSCCARVRWPWGKEIVEMDQDGRLTILPAFLETFTRLDGWGLTLDFIKAFPEVVDGMDLDAVLFTLE